MITLQDALTVFNTLTNFIFDINLLPGVIPEISVGSTIIIIGLIGAGITMITNYKG